MPTPIFPVLPPTGEPQFTELSKNDLHRATALYRLLEQYKDKARLKTLVDIYAQQFQELEDVFWDLYVKRRLDTAEGDQLRILGRIVGLVKGSTSDVDFRVLVAARIRVLLSRGTFNDLTRILRIVLGTDPIDVANRVFQEIFPAALKLELLTTPTFSTVILGRLLRAAKAAGVALQIDYPPPSGLWFTFDTYAEDGAVSSGWQDFGGISGGYFGREVF